MELAPSTSYLAEPTPNNCLTIVDIKVHDFALLSLDNFLKIWLKFALHVDRNPTNASLPRFVLILQHFLLVSVFNFHSNVLLTFNFLHQT